jgi:hypothetical protein
MPRRAAPICWRHLYCRKLTMYVLGCCRAKAAGFGAADGDQLAREKCAREVRERSGQVPRTSGRVGSAVVFSVTTGPRLVTAASTDYGSSRLLRRTTARHGCFDGPRLVTAASTDHGSCSTAKIDASLLRCWACRHNGKELETLARAANATRIESTVDGPEEHRRYEFLLWRGKRSVCTHRRAKRS